MKKVKNFLITENEDSDIININYIVSIENYTYNNKSGNKTNIRLKNDCNVYMKEKPIEVINVITGKRRN